MTSVVLVLVFELRWVCQKISQREEICMRTRTERRYSCSSHLQILLGFVRYHGGFFYVKFSISLYAESNHNIRSLIQMDPQWFACVYIVTPKQGPRVCRKRRIPNFAVGGSQLPEPLEGPHTIQAWDTYLHLLDCGRPVDGGNCQNKKAFRKASITVESS